MYSASAKIVVTTDKEGGIDMERVRIDHFLIGFSVGAAAGLVFALSSGNKMRSQITKAAADGATYFKECGEIVRDAVIDVAQRSKDQIGRHKEGVAEAIKRGSEAYRRAIS